MAKRLAAGEHTDWRLIDYHPAVEELRPTTLLPYLSGRERVLDVGCNTGSTAFFLAPYVQEVVGVDINPRAVHTARERAAAHRASATVKFLVSDFAEAGVMSQFDVVVMIRFLTCIPDPRSRTLVLQHAFHALTDQGILYIHDFMRSEQSVNYRERYEAGMRRGLGPGNFAVNDASGQLMFVAHHHSSEELSMIQSGFATLDLSFDEALSMHGNPCTMFRFLGRKSVNRAPESRERAASVTGLPA